MSATFTPWAADVIHRSVEAARRFNPDAGIRVFMVGGLLQSALADVPDPGDEQLVVRDVVVFVAAEIDGLIDVEAPHDRLVLKPAGAAPNERP